MNQREKRGPASQNSISLGADRQSLVAKKEGE
jgi:hypothetical protein